MMPSIKAQSAWLWSNCGASLAYALCFTRHGVHWDVTEYLTSCLRLQVMLAIDDTGALLRFVQRPNNVDLAEGERAYRRRGGSRSWWRCTRHAASTRLP